MKTKKGIVSVLMVLSMLAGVLAGCSDTNSTYDDNQNDTSISTNNDDTQDVVTVAEDVIGEVTYVGDDYLSLTTYASGSTVSDYAALDISTLTEVGGMDYVYPEADTEYYTVSDAMLVAAAYEDITAGCLIAVTTGTDGVQQIIILKEAAVEESADNTEVEDTELEDAAAEDETLDLTTYVVAEVSAVNDDGSLALLNYVSNEDALEYTIEDYTDIDFSQFSSDETTSDYVISEDSIIYLVESGETTEMTADGILIGDMLVIYTDEYGVTYIFVHPAETEAEVSE